MDVSPFRLLFHSIRAISSHSQHTLSYLPTSAHLLPETFTQLRYDKLARCWYRLERSVHSMGQHCCSHYGCTGYMCAVHAQCSVVQIQELIAIQ